jgi:hypothetical protein
MNNIAQTDRNVFVTNIIGVGTFRTVENCGALSQSNPSGLIARITQPRQGRRAARPCAFRQTTRRRRCESPLTPLDDIDHLIVAESGWKVRPRRKVADARGTLPGVSLCAARPANASDTHPPGSGGLRDVDRRSREQHTLRKANAMPDTARITAACTTLPALPHDQPGSTASASTWPSRHPRQLSENIPSLPAALDDGAAYLAKTSRAERQDHGCIAIPWAMLPI